MIYFIKFGLISINLGFEMKRRGASLLALGAWLSVVCAMETRTLDDFMNFTTRDMLISHPRTSALAWVETRRGVPNVLYMALENSAAGD